jgi:hypothetical protein
MAVPLSAVSSTLLPPTITGPIFAKASGDVGRQQLARRSRCRSTPTPPSPSRWTSSRPGGSERVASSRLRGGRRRQADDRQEARLLVPVSRRSPMTNPAGMYEQVVNDLPTALARAFDYAAINGKSLRTGNAGPFPDYLSQGGNTGRARHRGGERGGLYTDLVTGAGKVIDKQLRLHRVRRRQADAHRRDAVGRRQRSAAVHRHRHRPRARRRSTAPPPAAGRWRLPAFFSPGRVREVLAAGRQRPGRHDQRHPDRRHVQPLLGWQLGDPGVQRASTTTVQTAIRAWGGIYAGVTVTGSAGGPYTITFPAATRRTCSPRCAVLGRPDAPDRRHRGHVAGDDRATGAGRRRHHLRGIGGDWSQAAYGVGMDITLRSATRRRTSTARPGTPRSRRTSCWSSRGLLRLRDGRSARS